MLSECLSGYGLTLVWANDAEDALRKLEQKRFDVVVLDVMLPGLDGFGLLPRLRAVSNVPVLMLINPDRCVRRRERGAWGSGSRWCGGSRGCTGEMRGASRGQAGEAFSPST